MEAVAKAQTVKARSAAAMAALGLPVPEALGGPMPPAGTRSRWTDPDRIEPGFGAASAVFVEARPSVSSSSITRRGNRSGATVIKTALILVLLGALLGIVVASLVVPPALSWYTEPGGLPKGAQVQALVQIPEVIRYSTSKLIYWQAVGAGIGAALGLLISIVVLSGRRPREMAASQS
jgi:hypothetical protein